MARLERRRTKAGTDATVITEAANIASIENVELADWRELAKEKSTVLISWGCELAVGYFSHLR